MPIFLNLLGLLMCLLVFAAVLHWARENKVPWALWVSVILGIVFFAVTAIAEIFELVTGFDLAGSGVGTAASAGWQVLTDILWFLTVFPFMIALVFTPFFLIFGNDPGTEENRVTYLVGWLFVAGPAVLWNINPEVRQTVFGPLYRFVGLFSS